MKFRRPEEATAEFPQAGASKRNRDKAVSSSGDIKLAPKDKY